MDLKLKDKVVVVTGGGGAIGSAIAKSFAQEGAKVVVTGRTVATLEAIVNDIKANGGIAEAITCDVSKKESCEALVEKTVEKFGSLDVLVNNAGINGGPEYRKKIYDYDDGLWDRIMGCDLNGVYYMSKYAIRQMRKQETKGNLINISSIAGVLPLRLQVAFTAAKAGVINMSKAMAIELADEGIRVNVICPGSIMFEGTRALFYANKETSDKMMAAIPMHRPGEPEDIGAATCFLASDALASYITGDVMVIDGGWTSSIRTF